MIGPSLSALPAELLENIIVYNRERVYRVRNLRYTCRDVYEKTHNWFGRTFVQDIQVRMTPREFELLQGFAKNPSISRHLKGLTVSEFMKERNGFGYLWVRDEEGKLVEPLPEAFMKNLDSMLRNGFINCTSLSVVSTSREKQPQDSTKLHAIEAFIIILRVLIRINRNLSRVAVELYGDGSPRGYDPLDWDFFEAEESRTVLSHIQKLSIRSSLDSLPACVLSLLRNASGVQSLSIKPRLEWPRSSQSPKIPTCDLTDKYLITPRALSLTGSFLSELELTNMVFSKSSLGGLLLHFGPNLRMLNVDEGRLLGPDGCWLPFIRSLGSHMPKLRCLSLRMLKGTLEDIEFPSLETLPWMKEDWLPTQRQPRPLKPRTCIRVVSNDVTIHMIERRFTSMVYFIGFSYHGMDITSFLELVKETVQYVGDGNLIP